MTTARRRPPATAALAGDGHAPRDGGAGRPPSAGEGAIGPRAVRVSFVPALGHLDLAPIDIDPSSPAAGARLELLGPERAILHPGDGEPSVRVILEPPETGPDGRGVVRREVIVDGWRFEVELESARRAALRERARRGRDDAAHGGPTEVHAIIPGRIVSVSVVPGDPVVAGQQLLVVEAMKMQNELRAPRDGTVTAVGVAPGETIEIGDLLLVLE